MPKNKTWFWVAALAAACIFDFLFWQKSFGVSFLVWTAILLLLGYLLAWSEGKKPAPASILLTVLTLGFSFVPAWRTEPMTRVVSVMLTLGGLLLLSATFTTGHWPFYRMVDYFKNLFIAVGAGLSRAFTLGAKSSNPPPLEGEQPKKGGRNFWAIVRGLLIALPITALLGLLLTSADPIFGDWVAKILNIERLPEYLFRAFYVLMIMLLLIGLYLHAILPKKVEERPDPRALWMKPFLGWTETAIILGAVDLLFTAFVFIQVRYLFGGTANITETSYTYAEYARKGFGELVAVAVLSLGLYLCLHTITKREGRGSKAAFSVLTVFLMANVLVMLASSLQRLLLYEGAYGFSQLRTYTHVFIYWLAALILVTIILEILERRGHFGLALLVMIVGFGATLPILNVNGFITSKNIARAAAGQELDIPHLVSLKADAVPVLIEKFNDSTLPAGLKDDLGYTLACTQATLGDAAESDWQGFNLSQTIARSLLLENKSALSKYKVMNDDRGWYYLKNGVETFCEFTYMD